MRALRILILAVLIFGLISQSGKFLVVDNPQKADAILVLAGETDRRPARAVELMQQGYASRVILDVPQNERIFGNSDLQLAEAWIKAQSQPQAFSICSISGLSTKAESFESAECLRRAGARTVLMVTSDFHTRRASSIYRKEQPEFAFSVAAATAPAQFGANWWRHRQWAKVNLEEWFRLIWWECVDRWF